MPAKENGFDSAIWMCKNLGKYEYFADALNL
jgi:hypothetical protein